MFIYCHKHILLFACIVLAVGPLSAQVSEVWVTPFAVGTNSQEVYDMALDDSGNVYIAGYSMEPSGNGHDGFVAKLSPAGAVLWWDTHGPYGWTNWFRTLAVDDSGNVYASGFQYAQSVLQSSMSVKYNNTGQIQWVDTLWSLGGIDNISPANGSVLTLIDNSNITIRKHTGSAMAWETRNDTSTFSLKLYPRFIGVDSLGNIFVAGDRSTNADNRFFIKKFNSTGGFIWGAEHNPGTGDDYLEDMKVDQYGNSYLVGKVNISNGGFAIAKFRPSGSLAWSRLYNTNVVTAKSSAIDIDSDGNVYISGVYQSTSSNLRCHVIKYDSSGVFQWDAPLDSASVYYTDVAVGPGGNVYVTYAERGLFAYADYRTCRLSPGNGSVVWQIDYNGSLNDRDIPVKILLDAFANVFVTGMEQKMSGGNFATTIKYAQSVGVDEIEERNGLLVFPNPVADVFTIKGDRAFRSARVSVFNSLGEMVAEHNNQQGESITIARGNLSAGVYFIKIQDAGRTYNSKMILY